MFIEISDINFLIQCQLKILNVRRIGLLLQLRVYIALVSLLLNFGFHAFGRLREIRNIQFLLQLRIHIALVSLCRNRTRIRSLKRIKVRLRHLLPKFGSHLSIDSLLVLVLANVQNLMCLGKNAICRSRFGTR